MTLSLKTPVGKSTLEDFLRAIKFNKIGDGWEGSLDVLATSKLPSAPAPAVASGALSALELLRKKSARSGAAVMSTQTDVPANPDAPGHYYLVVTITGRAELPAIRRHYDAAKAAGRVPPKTPAPDFDSVARRKITRAIEGMLLQRPAIVAPLEQLMPVAAGDGLADLGKLITNGVKSLEPIGQAFLSAYIGPNAAAQVNKVINGVIGGDPKAKATVKDIGAKAKAGDAAAKQAADALKASAAAQEAAKKVVQSAATPNAAKPPASSSAAPTSAVVMNFFGDKPGGPIDTRYIPPPLAHASGSVSPGGRWVNLWHHLFTPGERG